MARVEPSCSGAIGSVALIKSIEEFFPENIKTARPQYQGKPSPKFCQIGSMIEVNKHEDIREMNMVGPSYFFVLVHSNIQKCIDKMPSLVRPAMKKKIVKNNLQYIASVKLRVETKHAIFPPMKSKLVLYQLLRRE